MRVKPSQTGYPVHELIEKRWSSRAFSDREVESEKIGSLLEAARWAASSRNEQPWRFLVTTRAESRDRLLQCVSEGNRGWAKYAPVLILVATRSTWESRDAPNGHAFHDAGLAVASLSIQATALDLIVHQIAGFDGEQARRKFELPKPFDPVSVLAIGYYGDPDRLPENRKAQEDSPRQRKPLGEIAFLGEWGTSFT